MRRVALYPLPGRLEHDVEDTVRTTQHASKSPSRCTTLPSAKVKFGVQERGDCAVLIRTFVEQCAVPPTSA